MVEEDRGGGGGGLHFHFHEKQADRCSVVQTPGVQPHHLIYSTIFSIYHTTLFSMFTICSTVYQFRPHTFLGGGGGGAVLYSFLRTFIIFSNQNCKIVEIIIKYGTNCKSEEQIVKVRNKW